MENILSSFVIDEDEDFWHTVFYVVKISVPIIEFKDSMIQSIARWSPHKLAIKKYILLERNMQGRVKT